MVKRTCVVTDILSARQCGPLIVLRVVGLNRARVPGAVVVGVGGRVGYVSKVRVRTTWGARVVKYEERLVCDT